MSEIGEWGESRNAGRTRILSEERKRYLAYLRGVHHRDKDFRLAVRDAMEPDQKEVDKLIFEAEMLANYEVF